MSGHTPGPWAWFGNARNHEIYLATEHSGRRYVMGFRRWGMRGAQPTFQPAGCGLVAAEKLLMFEVGDQSVRGVEQAAADDSVYRMDIRDIDCADARLIASAPDLLTELCAVRDACLYTDDDASGDYIAVTSEPHISSEQFDRICAAIAKATALTSAKGE